MEKRSKFEVVKNIKHGIAGFYEVFKHEYAFKLEVYVFSIITIFLIFANIPTLHKLIIIMTFFIALIVEVINSAIERCVDLVTVRFHIMAKRAKDAAATAVLFSFTLCIVTGAVFFYLDYIKTGFLFMGIKYIFKI